MPQRMSAVWVDAGGHTAAHLLTTSGGAASVLATLEAKSNAAVQISWEGALAVVAAPAPVAAVYQAVRDVALLEYQTAAGSIVKVYLPAPQAGIFMADGETVDPALIGAITAAVIANVVTPGGAAIVSFVGGSRLQSR